MTRAASSGTSSSLTSSRSRERASDGRLASKSGVLPDNSVVDFEVKDVYTRGGVAIGVMLVENCHLLRLDLAWNALGASSGVAIGGGLARNRQLQFLDLGYTSLGETGCAALGRALDTNGRLAFLGLSRAGVGHMVRAVRRRGRAAVTLELDDPQRQDVLLPGICNLIVGWLSSRVSSGLFRRGSI